MDDATLRAALAAGWREWRSKPVGETGVVSQVAER
jgi:hypothetical protein